MSNSFYHKDLTDAQWARIKFLFEKPCKVGHTSLNPRMVLNGILWILRSGARWRDLPARYGNWNSIYHKFRQWCNLGIFERLLKIINGEEINTTLLEIDSTFCKVHQSAGSGLKKQAIGVSRGGQIHDSEPVVELFKGVELKGKKVLADKAYSTEFIRSYLQG